MDLGPLGLSELLVIGILALIVFGPRRLPELAETAGRMMTKLRRASLDLRRTYEAEIKQETSDWRALDETRREITTELAETTRAVRSAVEGAVPRPRQPDAGPRDPEPPRGE